MGNNKYSTVDSDDEDDYKQGNKCCFSFFKLMNVLLLLEAIIFIGLGAYLWSQVGQMEFFSATLLTLGAIVLIVSYMGYISRKSTLRLLVYLIIMGVICLIMLVLTILGGIFQDKIIDKLADDTNSHKSFEQLQKIMSKHWDFVFYGSIVAVVIQFFCVFLSYIYRKSLKRSINNHTKEKQREKRRELKGAILYNKDRNRNYTTPNY